MAETEGSNILIDGRIVFTLSRSIFDGRKKLDDQTKAPRLNKQGQEMWEYGFGLAVPKASAQEFYNAAQKEALKAYPSGQFPPDFAWKFKDGDGIDHLGKPFNQREGYAGCIVIACITSMPIKWFRWENGSNIMINEGVKCGDYVKACLTIKAHPPQGRGKAGLYVNPSAVQFLGHGKEIINAPSGDQLFGTAAPSLPPGASAMPIAPPTTGIPGFGQPPQGMPQQPPVQQMAPQPHYGVMPPAHQPPAGGQPVPMGIPPGYAPPVQPQQPPTPPMMPQQQPQGFPPMPGGFPQQR